VHVVKNAVALAFANVEDLLARRIFEKINVMLNLFDGGL